MMRLNSKIIKRSSLALLAIVTFGATTAQAALVGRYNWGYFYSTMNGKTVTSETDTTSPSYKTYAIANNGQAGGKGRRTGPWAYINQASVARTKQTAHQNKTGYQVKSLGRDSDNTDSVTFMQNLD